MSKSISILLIALFAAVASGGASYVHEMQEHTHASLGTARINLKAADEGHDEATCLLCAVLHMPTLAEGFAAALICLCLFVAFLTQIHPPLASQRAPLLVDCRGPPVR